MHSLFTSLELFVTLHPVFHIKSPM